MGAVNGFGHDGASDPEARVQIAGALWMLGEPLAFRIVLVLPPAGQLMSPILGPA
jgi:hypothetical protein